MTQKWNNDDGTAYPAADVADDIDVFGAAVINGIDTVRTDYAGSADPSSGAPTAWGATDVGTRWLDTTDPNNPVAKQWVRLAATPTYGWRTLYSLRVLWYRGATLPDAIAAASIAADSAHTNVSLAAVADADFQPAGNVAGTCRFALLRVYIKGATAHPTGDKQWIELKETGTGNSIKVVAVGNGIPHYQDVWIGLDSSERFSRAYDTNAGAAGFDVEVKVKALMEYGA